MMNNAKHLQIIGGGLAGSEAAWQAANAGVSVQLHEMRPTRSTDAHQTDGLAELVCSNSFRSDDAQSNAVGVLHEEMRRAGSLIMACADRNQVPAGGALAVDRDGFSNDVTKALSTHPLIDISRGEVSVLPDADQGPFIIATGPLTSDSLAQSILEVTGEEALAFFDAIAPIIYKESIDFDKAWFQSRYDKKGPGGDGADYINCGMNEDQYTVFYEALTTAEKTVFKEWEKSTPYFEACLPIEVMAERGRDTLRFGPMKPVGLTNAHTGDRPFAVVQLRQDNALGTLYNMVGFQTKLKYGAQADVFRLIPGLEKAEFARLGGIHRNTFLNSPKLLTQTLQLKARPNIRFAGQVTGVEGYIESAAIGLLAGQFAADEILGLTTQAPPNTTALGALLGHITGGHISADSEATASDEERAEKPGGKVRLQSFQPMNVNFGLFPQVPAPSRDENGKRLRGKEKGRARKQVLAQRALEEIDVWISDRKRSAPSGIAAE